MRRQITSRGATNKSLVSSSWGFHAIWPGESAKTVPGAKKALQAAGKSNSAYCKDDSNWHLSPRLHEMQDSAGTGRKLGRRWRG